MTTGAAGLRALDPGAAAGGLVAAFHAAGVLALADVHVARRLSRLGGEDDERVLLAGALAVRAVRAGSVCVDLAHVREAVPDDEDAPVDLSLLPWPASAAWLEACAASPLVAGEEERWAPLRLVDGLLYLDRYFQQEQVVRRSLDERAGRPPPPVDVPALRASLARLFPATGGPGGVAGLGGVGGVGGAAGAGPDRQRLAVAVAATRWVTVLAGGPGTGKTTTVARLLAALGEQPGPRPRIALAAPTGKAAARLQEAVQGAGLGLEELTASTLHRLLGWRPGNRSRFLHDRDHHLPYDVVVVDETSMVSLTLMSRLLEAVRPDARLVLVGDPDQLASVEAGAVLGDLVARPAPAGSPTAPDPVLAALVPGDLPADIAAPAEDGTGGEAARLRRGVARLSRIHRYGGEIAELAAAVRDGDPDRAVALLRSGTAVSLVEDGSSTALRAEVVAAARPLVRAAAAGDAAGALVALDAHRLLCAHRRGPYGVGHWAGEVAGWLAEAGLRSDDERAVGRAVIVTTNDHELQLYNGDTGVLIAGPRGTVVAFARAGGPLLLSPSRLPLVQSIDALTVHRSQGSQFTAVTIVLPPPESPLLTRELLYTALSRAREYVRVLGTEAAVRAAVTRPVVRASGLRRSSP